MSVKDRIDAAVLALRTGMTPQEVAHILSDPREAPTVREWIERARAAKHDALGVANDPEWPSLPGFTHVKTRTNEGEPCDRCGEARFRPTDTVVHEWGRWYDAPRERQCIPLNPDDDELRVRAAFLPKARERLGQRAASDYNRDDDQMWHPPIGKPIVAGAPNALATRVDRERSYLNARADQELARAMLLDIRDAESDPMSPINHNPMRNMIARLCRAVLRAYNQPDPTKE